MTWPIVARDDDGAFGVAVASKAFAVGALCAQAPWMAICPGLSIFPRVLSFNLPGDGLRDALDPRHV